MRTNEPPTRLRDFLPGQRVLLAGVERVLTIIRIREDGYFDLTNQSGALAVTAAPCHLCAEAEK